MILNRYLPRGWPHPCKSCDAHLYRYKLFGKKNKQMSRRVALGTFLDQIPYPVLIVVAIFMFLAPFRPMPHVLEKLLMLKNGTLTRPIDIFDLFFHLLPLVVLIFKLMRDYGK